CYLAIAVLLPAAAFADAPGASITGSVLDDTGTLPGVVVELVGEKFPQPLSQVTDLNGTFRFAGLEQGTYMVRASFAGGTPVSVNNIKLKTSQALRLDPIIFKKETVLVQAALDPMLQHDTTTLGTSFVPQMLSTVPTGRTYTDVIALAPGVSGSDGTGGQVVYGATGLESSFVIDGMNTTSVESGLPSKKLGFDLIDKIEVKAGAYEAEYGGAHGAGVNVTTKSGSNTFTGAMAFYYAPQDLAADAKTNGFGTSSPAPEGRELSGNLGGPIVRDRVFFFLSASRLFENRLAEQRDPDLF